MEDKLVRIISTCKGVVVVDNTLNKEVALSDCYLESDMLSNGWEVKRYYKKEKKKQSWRR